MQAYVASKSWKDGYGAGETRITAADLTHMESGISAATQGVTNVETKVAALQEETKGLSGKISEAAANVSDVLHKAVPIGSVLIWMSTTPPEGWLICNGRTLNRADYPDLFKVLGTRFGSTSSTTFSIPNMGGRMPIGEGGTFHLGGVGGEAAHKLTVDEMPSHNHGVGGNIVNRADGTSGFRELAAVPVGGNNSTSAFTGGGREHNNMPPYIGVNFIIKATQ